MRTRAAVSLLFAVLAAAPGAQTPAAPAAPPAAEAPARPRAADADPQLVAAMTQALAGKPAAFPDAPFARADEAKVRAATWAAYKAAAIASGWDKVLPEAAPVKARNRSTPPSGTLTCAPETMPFFLVRKGERPEHGWPLFFQMHGGGSTDDKLPGPHGWEVNSQDWQVQLTLIAQALPGGLWFVPRMANDNRGRWWYRHNHVAFDQVLRCALLFADVDPERIYMMGISEGAYGTEALLPFWPDRFAGGCALAGGAGGGERMWCLRNCAFRSDTGEKDTMYKRVELAQHAHAVLDELQKADPAGFDHVLALQAGRGHGIDYRPGAEWLAGKKRTARPTKVCWYSFALDGSRRIDCHWLGLSAAPTSDALLVATADRKTNTIAIEAHQNPAGKDESPVYGAPRLQVADRQPLHGGELYVWLDDTLLDLDQPVTITLNGAQAFAGKVARSAAVVADTTARFGDPLRVFTARVAVALPKE